MPKKEEKDKKEETVEEKIEPETAEKESQPEPSKEPAGSEQIISEASVQPQTNEPVTPKTNISMDPIATPAGDTSDPVVAPIATPAAQSGVPAVDETVAEKPTQETYPLADEIEKESQPEPSKEPAGSEQIISEASVQLPTDEPTTPKTNISMDPIATPAGETTVPAVGPVATPAAQSGVPAVDETVAEKPTQETYPLADEIEKDAQKKRSLLSALLIFRNKKGKIILLCLVALLLVALAAGTILNSERDKLSFMNRNNKPRETVVLSPTQAPTATPVPAEVDKKTLKIEVQNGTGESGVAGKMKNLLVEKGYEGTIETGNADNYDYTETVLKIKKTKIGIQKELETDLSDDYTLSKSVENLEDDSDYDVVVIVGAE